MNIPLSFETSENFTAPEGFLMVLASDRKAYWKAGLSDFDSIYEQFALEPGDQYLNIYAALQNGHSYPYVFPEEGTWTAYLESRPAWFDDECRKIVQDSFDTWAQTVYSKFDYRAAGNVSERVAEILEVAPGDGYEASEDDIKLFHAYARFRFTRDDMYDIIVKELGQSVGDNAYRYLKENLADKLRNEAAVAPLLRSIGITSAGGTQENFGGACIAGYFTPESEDWNRFKDIISLADQILSRGMTFSEGSDKKFRLHSFKGGRILSALLIADATDDHAFSCVVDKEGKVYWKLGIDNYITLREKYGLTPADSAAFKVEPELNGRPETYVVPDGLNPEVDRHFEFFEEDAADWKIHSLDKGGKPDWVDEKMEASVMEACRAWREEAFSHIDRNALFTFFEKGNYAASYGEEEIRLMKDYVMSLKRPGPPAKAAFMNMVAETIGPTLAANVEDWIFAKWRLVHTACPQPNMKIGYCRYKKYDKFNKPNQRIDDTFPYLAAAHFLKDINWHTEDGSCPFESAAELMRRGYVVFYDFENWYLAAGEECDVLLEISEDDLFRL